MREEKAIALVVEAKALERLQSTSGYVTGLIQPMRLTGGSAILSAPQHEKDKRLRDLVNRAEYDEKTLRQLLIAGASVDQREVIRPSQMTCLTELAADRPALFRLLLLAGPDVDWMSNRVGAFPVMSYVSFVQKGRMASAEFRESLRLFVMAGGHVDGKLGHRAPAGFYGGDTILSLAKRNKDAQLVTLLEGLQGVTELPERPSIWDRSARTECGLRQGRYNDVLGVKN
jgi:hypothetical protein